MNQTTIAAIATPLAVGALGIVRLSGPESIAIATRIFQPVGKRTPQNTSGYSAIYGKIVAGAEEIDEAVLFLYRNPRSYTGEDVVEFSCHGGLYLLERVLRACLEEGAVPAQPGEFTKRAFLNGKMDLTQAEAVMDLISAKGKEAGRAAMAARDGAVSRQVEEVCDILTNLAAHLGAWIDYPEEDIEEVEDAHLRSALEGAQGTLNHLLSTYDTGRILREGVTTAIVGRPNVGKSTLMNRLAGFHRSIVTEIPGTTRDVVEDVVRLEDGLILQLADTAGLRQTEDQVEQLGVALARDRLENSDLILAVFDPTQPLEEEDLALLDQLKGRPAVAIWNKADLAPQMAATDWDKLVQAVEGHGVVLSAKTGEGMEQLTATIREVLQLSNLEGGSALLANERQRSCVRRGASAVQDGLEAVLTGVTLDAVSVCIDEALEALLELTGRRTTEAVVEQVFSQFCVGK